MSKPPMLPRPDHAALVTSQFGAQAGAYVTSAVHESGWDLAHIAARLDERGAQAVLDLGCGGGHVAYAAAVHAARVTAYDLSDAMLAAVRDEAAKRGLANIETVQGPAEALPFPDAAFDAVVSRFSLHHWADPTAALREVRRVLKPDGIVILADVAAPEPPALDSFLQTIELLRDPSHARDQTRFGLQVLLQQAALRADAVEAGRLRLEFASWVARMRTPAAHVAAIRALQACATTEARAHFAIEADGSFTVDTLLIEAVHRDRPDAAAA